MNWGVMKALAPCDAFDSSRTREKSTVQLSVVRNSWYKHTKKEEFGCSHHCPSKADIQGLVYRGQNKIILSLSSAVVPGAM